ncbi:hypothetical protein Ancab_015932 [Ancistrocladus abbreviatus]
MAAVSLPHKLASCFSTSQLPHPLPPSHSSIFSPFIIFLPYSSSSKRSYHHHHGHGLGLGLWSSILCLSRRSRYFFDEEDEEGEQASLSSRFEEAVELFNRREFYACHDILESLWYSSPDPLRTLLHSILQCAVGFHHLFNQNHRGAMMELGEGLCKLRKMNFEGGPFYQFEQEISAVLDFIYQTQLEQAACSDDFCIAMDQTERSYQLLGGFAAGQHLYHVESDPNHIQYIVFDHERAYSTAKVRLPKLHATAEHLTATEYQ